MKKINYKSDFDFVLRLKDCTDPEKTVAFPECEFDVRFWTANKANAYTASYKGGVYTNCFRTEDGGMHFVFDNHRMGRGALQAEPHFELPNNLYPDSIQDIFRKELLDITLVDGSGDCPTTAEIEAILPYIKGDKGERGEKGDKGEKGDAFTYADFTAEHMAELQKPAVDAAQKADTAATKANEAAQKANNAADGITDKLEKKADKTEISNIKGTPTDAVLEDIEPGIVANVLRKTAQLLTPEEQAQVKANLAISKMELFDDLWREAFGIWGDVDHTHIENGKPAPYYGNGLWMTYDEATRIYNLCVGWHKRIAGESPRGKMSLNCNVRTALPIYYAGGDPQLNFNGFAQYNSTLEVLRFIDNAQNNMTANISYAFFRCVNLRHIYGRIILSAQTYLNSAFENCRNLESVQLFNLQRSISFADSAKLSLDSLAYMIQHYKSFSSIAPGDATITVHPDVFAKLTDEANTEWHAVYTAAQAKNISFATT